MTPFPAWLEGRLLLVACRWPTASADPVRVPVLMRVEGEETRAWLRAGVTSVDEGLASLSLELSLESEDDRVPRPSAAERGAESEVEEGAASHVAGHSFHGITIVGVEADTPDGPTGVADTLVVCDVSGGEGWPARARGELVSAEVRIRRARLDAIGRAQPLFAEEWVGALMHELGHALGFEGHVAHGESILVLEQGDLRAAGRRALAGRATASASLAALYHLEPGTILGAVELTSASLAWLERLMLGLQALERSGVEISGPFAGVGDRHGQLEWRSKDGRRFRIRLPQWSRQLREGAPIIAIPDAKTRAWLSGS
jgi:hypothetical protein